METCRIGIVNTKITYSLTGCVAQYGLITHHYIKIYGFVKLYLDFVDILDFLTIGRSCAYDCKRLVSSFHCEVDLYFCIPLAVIVCSKHIGRNLHIICTTGSYSSIGVETNLSCKRRSSTKDRCMLTYNLQHLSFEISNKCTIGIVEHSTLAVIGNINSLVELNNHFVE